MNLKPLFKTDNLKLFSVVTITEMVLPYVENGIAAGFPLPANDFWMQLLI